MPFASWHYLLLLVHSSFSPLQNVPHGWYESRRGSFCLSIMLLKNLPCALFFFYMKNQLTNKSKVQVYIWPGNGLAGHLH